MSDTMHVSINVDPLSINKTCADDGKTGIEIEDHTGPRGSFLRRAQILPERAAMERKFCTRNRLGCWEIFIDLVVHVFSQSFDVLLH